MTTIFTLCLQNRHRLPLALLFALILHLSPRSQNLNAGLTACYELNGNAVDAASGLNGTLSAVTATVDRFGNPNSAMHFAGAVGSVISLPDHPSLKPSSDLSISCWINSKNFDVSYIVFTKNSQSVNHEAYELYIGPQYRFMARKCKSPYINGASSTTTLNVNVWYHLACTFDNSTVKIYVNGVLEGTTAVTFNGFDYVNGKKVIVGGTMEAFDVPFKGTIDNLRFYNRVLTAAEVGLLYSQDPACSILTAASEREKENSFRVFPNPAETNIHVEALASEGFEYALTDLAGKSILSATSTNRNIQINISELSAGIYFLNLKTENSTVRKKIIKY
jgi:hypothetical protein